MPDFQKLIAVANKVLNAKEGIEFQSFIYELQDRITMLMEKCSAQEKEIMTLNQKLVEYDNWEKEKEKYEVAQDSRRNTVYRLKGTTQIFCPVCLNKSRLPVHLTRDGNISVNNSCHSCHGKFPFDVFELS